MCNIYSDIIPISCQEHKPRVQHIWYRRVRREYKRWEEQNVFKRSREQLKNRVKIKVCIWCVITKKVDSFILHPKFSILLKSPLGAHFLLLESKGKKVNILDPSAQCVPYLSASVHARHIQYNTSLIIVSVSPFTYPIIYILWPSASRCHNSLFLGW